MPNQTQQETLEVHAITLNARGDTVETLAGSGDSLELHEAIRSWLHQSIG